MNTHCIAYTCENKSTHPNGYCDYHHGFVPWTDIPDGSLFEFQPKSERGKIHRKQDNHHYFDRLHQNSVKITGYALGVMIKARVCES